MKPHLPCLTISLIFAQFIFLSGCYEPPPPIDDETIVEEGQRLRLTVEGIVCPSCIPKIKAGLKSLQGIKSVKISMQKSIDNVEIRYDPLAINKEEIIKNIEEGSYKVMDYIAP